MTLLERMGRRLSPGGRNALAAFVRKPPRIQLLLATRFARGLWVSRHFDTRALVEAGRDVRVEKRNGAIYVDRLCRLQEGVRIGVTGKQGQAVLTLGYDVGINARTRINVIQAITIGAGCRIGWDCDLMDNDFHHILWLDREPGPLSAPIVLEEKVWVGARCMILKGVTIGAHSVIAAGSIVTRDVPPYSLAAGIPTRVIREIAGWDIASQ